MAARTDPKRPPLITSARFGRSLSTDQRTRRYMVTMAFRVVAFFFAVLTPLPWNIVLLVAAAILPGVAVLLGNAADNRKPSLASDDDADVERLALTSGEIVRGDVADGPDDADPGVER